MAVGAARTGGLMRPGTDAHIRAHRGWPASVARSRLCALPPCQALTNGLDTAWATEAARRAARAYLGPHTPSSAMAWKIRQTMEMGVDPIAGLRATLLSM